jgi:hypothetical protein
MAEGMAVSLGQLWPPNWIRGVSLVQKSHEFGSGWNEPSEAEKAQVNSDLGQLENTREVDWRRPSRTRYVPKHLCA